MQREEPPVAGPFAGDPEWGEYILWAYRVLLGREMEPEASVSDSPYRSRRELVSDFIASPEFRRVNGVGSYGRIHCASPLGFTIYADADDHVIGAPTLVGGYEPHVQAILRRSLQPGMNVLDVGANVGFFTMLAASLVGPQGVVTAVEANPENIRLLEASRRANGYEHVRVAGLAAAAEFGVLTLRTDGLNGMTLPINGIDDILSASQTVPCAPIRVMLPPDRRLDLVKIDVEGAEQMALAGCEEILRRDQPVILSELSPGQLQGISGVEASAYLGFLLDLGLELAVTRFDGSVRWCGRDIGAVVDEYEAIGSGCHIDIVAAPESARARLEPRANAEAEPAS